MAIAVMAVFSSVVASGQSYDVYGTWSSGSWWQEIGYVGVGNQNEVLAVGEVSLVMPTIPTSEYYKEGSRQRSGSTSNLLRKDFTFTLNYRLLGKAADPKYVKKIKLWARRYDATNSFNTTRVTSTFAYPFDYRDPIGKSDAVLLAEKTDVSATGSFVESILPVVDRYVFYITADISEDLDPKDPDDVPYLTSANKAELGANITSISYTQTISYDYYYEYRGSSMFSGWTSTSGKGEYNAPLTTVSLSRKGRNGANGSRVLVPQRKVLYSPNDFYSKYYRIPALAKAADGSIIAISDARKYHIHDVTNDIDILARRSTDNGITWSNPVTLAKGTGFVEPNTCSSGQGNGDAAIAALPNGDLLVTMISGWGFRATQNTQVTGNSYCVSHDNGQSWSPIKEISQDLYNSERGCIAPGNMCVVKHGPLAGKVIACLRSAVTRTGSGTHCNYMLLYDPETDNWSRIDFTTGTFYRYGSGDDEAHLVEIGENTFLLSIRVSDGNAGNRYFARLDYSPATGKFTATHLSSDGMSLDTYCNGDIMNYEAQYNGSNQTFQLHALASSKEAAQLSTAANGVRSGLRTFYTQYTGGNSISWNASTVLSDPYHGETYRNETAQYASMTTLNDGSLGFFFEEYPQIIRINETCGNGDYLMQDVYMQLRIGDIIPNAEPIDREKLLAPTINPQVVPYDCADPTSRPDPIVISHENTLDEVNTIYKIYVYGPDGAQIGVINNNFAGNSISLNWNDLMLNGQPLESYVYGQDNSGTYLRVVAMCQKDGFQDSDVASQIYLFKTPVRLLKIEARAAAGWGDPYLQSELIGTYEQGRVMVVGTGSLVIANAADKYPYSFKGFSLSKDTYVPLTAAQQAALKTQVITPHQTNFKVPTEDVLANNDGDNLTIYAWYESRAMGIKTRVYSNYHDSAKDNEEAQQTGVYKRHYFHNDWYPVEVYAGNDFPEASPNLTFDNVRNKGNNYATTNLEYNLVNEKAGLDANVVVMPDSRAMAFNAIVLVKSVNADSYVNKAPARAAATNAAKYYLIQGNSAPFAAGSTVAANATGVYNWYTTNAFGQLMPVKVDGISFLELVPKGVTSATNKDFDVEVYIVNGNTLSGVSALDNEANYEVKIVHRIRYSNSVVTAIDDLGTNRDVKSVRYYNAAGVQSNVPFRGINIVVTEYADGTRKAVKIVK